MSALLLNAPAAAAAIAEVMPLLFGLFASILIFYMFAVLVFIKSKAFYWRMSAWFVAVLLTTLGVYGVKSPATDLDAAFASLFIPLVIGVLSEYLLRKKRFVN